MIAPNRLSISNYPPYPGWEEFHSSIEKAYAAYRSIVAPGSIERVGLRYINVINFGTNAISPPEFFNYYPNIGASLPQDNQNVRMSVEFACQDFRDIARLQLSTRPGSTANSLAVQLDIDYFLVISGSIGLEQIEEWLHEAHSAIGELFEGSITDKTREMFRG